nr:gliding motility lipoprotein GldH [Prevotella sp.]
MKKIIFALILVSLSACNKNTLYEKYNHTAIAGWEKNDTLFFDVPRTSVQGTFTDKLGLRINGYYPFTGLTLIVEQTVYPRDITYTDTISCPLVDPVSGRYKGHGVSYYQYIYDIRNIDLHLGDSLHISVRHDMKREILPGISDIGMEITRTQD